jgi:hypothetical protein
MADQKTSVIEEVKWWIDRGSVKERDKHPQLGRGVIEKWVFELLKDYSQDQAVRNVVDINPRTLKEFTMPPGEWGYLSLGVGRYPDKGLARIKRAIPLPSYARALAIDAGYSVRVMITGEPIGERLVDINFIEAPSLDYWVNGELVEEKLFSNVEETLKKLRKLIPSYLPPPDLP